MKSIAETRLSPSEKEAVLEFREQVVRMLPTVEVFLYGSKARGDATEFSDIDLLVLVAGPIDRDIERRIYSVKFDIELRHDVIIGMLLESRTFWDSPRVVHTPLHENISREEIPV